VIPRVLVSGTICEGEVSEPGKHVTASALDSMHQALMRFATAIASNLGDLKLYTGFPWPTDGGPVLREVEGHQNAVRWTKEALLTHVRGAMQLCGTWREFDSASGMCICSPYAGPSWFLRV